jgi:hypothetical protein
VAPGTRVLLKGHFRVYAALRCKVALLKELLHRTLATWGGIFALE